MEHFHYCLKKEKQANIFNKTAIISKSLSVQSLHSHSIVVVHTPALIRLYDQG